jgi:hypothetical protein
MLCSFDIYQMNLGCKVIQKDSMLLGSVSWKLNDACVLTSN